MKINTVIKILCSLYFTDEILDNLNSKLTLDIFNSSIIKL